MYLSIVSIIEETEYCRHTWHNREGGNEETGEAQGEHGGKAEGVKRKGGVAMMLCVITALYYSSITIRSISILLSTLN